MEMRTVKMVSDTEWDKLVMETYGKRYCFQQQDGCKDRQVVKCQVPSHEYDYKNDSMVEEANGPEEGVSFKAWLARDPKEPMKDEEDGTRWLEMFWDRNFYPEVSMIINDLHKRGLLEKGDFSIEIDW